MCQTLDNRPGFGWVFLVLYKICKIFTGAVTEPANPSMVVGYLLFIVLFFFVTLVSSKFIVYLQYWSVSTLELGVGMSTSHCFLDSCGQH